MRRAGWGFVVVLLLSMVAVDAQAQSPVALRSTYENVIIGEAFGFETITLAGSAAVLTPAKITPADVATKGEATSAMFTVNTGTTTFCFEGTTATASLCHAFPAGTSFLMYGTKTLKLISVYSAGATVSVSYFRQKGK